MVDSHGLCGIRAEDRLFALGSCFKRFMSDISKALIALCAADVGDAVRMLV